MRPIGDDRIPVAFARKGTSVGRTDGRANDERPTDGRDRTMWRFALGYTQTDHRPVLLSRIERDPPTRILFVNVRSGPPPFYRPALSWSDVQRVRERNPDRAVGLFERGASARLAVFSSRHDLVLLAFSMAVVGMVATLISPTSCHGQTPWPVPSGSILPWHPRARRELRLSSRVRSTNEEPLASGYSGAIVTLQAPASHVAIAWPHPRSVQAIPSQFAGLC